MGVLRLWAWQPQVEYPLPRLTQNLLRHPGRSRFARKPFLCNGNELAQFWRAVFGYGLDCLTNVEAGYLSRVESFDASRTQMAEAAELARRRGLSAIDRRI